MIPVIGSPARQAHRIWNGYNDIGQSIVACLQANSPTASSFWKLVTQVKGEHIGKWFPFIPNRPFLAIIVE